MTKYLLISGPPGAGKDTVGNIVQELMPGRVTIDKFARPLMAAAAAFGFDMADTLTAKSRMDPYLGNMARREFQIKLSEAFAKPLMGEGVFGKALLARTRGVLDLVVVTDSGFLPEARVLVDAVGVGNVLRIHLSRPGHDYQGDSRTDWKAPDGLHCIDLDNRRNREDLALLVRLALIELDLLDDDD